MTRLGSMAEQLGALRRYFTEPDHTPEPIETNWSVTPANDNSPEDLEGMKIDRLWDISPSVGEIIRQVTTNAKVENAAGQTISWGRLRFSDGGQTEQGFKLTIDGKVVVANFIVPPGGMLGTNDKERAQRGGNDNPQELKDSNNYFGGADGETRVAGLFKAIFSKPVKRAPRKERNGPKTKSEERQWLADAIANTPVMPAVKYCPDGFPASPAKLAQLFPGMVKVATGGSGSLAWEDIVSQRESRDEWFRWVDQLDGKDKAVLEAARSARTYADVGMAVGQSRFYADKKSGGRKALLAANDNLMSAIKNYAA